MSNVLKNLSVLIVEDEAGTLALMSDVLSLEFDSVFTAKNGDEGIKKFKKYNPDIVISDIAMPILDGLEMARQIKAIRQKTLVVLLSAHSEKERLLQAIDASVDKYIIKPIDMDELIGILVEFAKNKIKCSDIVELKSGLSFDVTKKLLLRNTEIIPLSKKELVFVNLLIQNDGGVVDMQEIKEKVWQNKAVNDTAVRTFIKRIRDKAGVNFIKNIPTIGYKIG